MMSDLATERHDELGGRHVEAHGTAEDQTAAWKRRFPFLNANGLRGGRGAVDAVDPDHVATAIAFLKMFRPTKRGTIGSYTLKHDAENWGAKHGMNAYVTNGSLIVAALQLGLAVEEYPDSTNCPNARIGISRHDYRKFKAR